MAIKQVKNPFCVYEKELQKTNQKELRIEEIIKKKGDKLYVDNLLPVPVHLSTVSDVGKNDVVKKYIYNAKIGNIEDKITDN